MKELALGRGVDPIAAVLVALLAGACGGAAAMPAEQPRSNLVEVGKADAPLGSVSVGPIEAVHGSGCGGFGETGTFEGAMIALRNEAARRNANYVAILSTTPPHSENGCFDQQFVIRGIAYQVAPTAASAGAAPVAPAAGGCDPPCSPGYRCVQATCLAVCNPLCGADQVCRQDRTCGPAEPAKPAPRP